MEAPKPIWESVNETWSSPDEYGDLTRKYSPVEWTLFPPGTPGWVNAAVQATRDWLPLNVEVVRSGNDWTLTISTRKDR